MTAAQLALFDRPETSSIVEELSQFRYRGVRTIVEDRGGIPFFFNEFWTARQRQGHAIHEISYRACFKSQLPEFFIDRLTNPLDVVYDPFMGRGTTPIQAVLMDRIGIGNDINPLSKYLARPRTNPPTVTDIANRLRDIAWSGSLDNADELLVFYHPDTLREINALRSYLAGREVASEFDGVDDWIRMIALNRLTGHSPGFFSVYSLPPNQAVSVGAQRKINEKREQTPPRRVVPDIILKKSKSLLKDGVPPTPRIAEFHTASANKTPDIETSSVNLVVTSPPFLDIVQYAGDNWLRCWFAGIDADVVPIAMHKKPADWRDFTRGVFHELGRVVRSGGHVCFEVGEVRGGQIELETLVLDAIKDLPFAVMGVLINVQEFTKTANCWGVSNNSKGTNTNRVIIAKRL